jgi:hypothetical protein
MLPISILKLNKICTQSLSKRVIQGIDSILQILFDPSNSQQEIAILIQTGSKYQAIMEISPPLFAIYLQLRK